MLTFHPTADVDANGLDLRAYAGQQVTVVGRVPDVDPEITEPLLIVRAQDGTTFHAWGGELT